MRFAKSSEGTSFGRWLVLLTVCVGTAMVLLDGSIVYVALPFIRADLGFPEKSLVWVINGYLIPYAGLFLLCGRLGDVYGHPRLFLIGIVIFTAASLVCGVAGSLWLLVGARAVQGAAAAAVAAASVSYTMQAFEEPEERARAISILCSVQAGGSSVGLLLGGVVTYVGNWRWIFLVNLPAGIAVCFLYGVARLSSGGAQGARLPGFAGSMLVTSSALLLVYASLNAATTGWLSITTLVSLVFSLGLFTLFWSIAAHARDPLVPPTLFQVPNLRVSVISSALWSGSMYVWGFILTLYLQHTLRYDALQLGLSFLPGNLIMAMFSRGVSTNLGTRFGFRALSSCGLAVVAAGMFFASRVPLSANYGLDVLPSILLVGLGAGLAASPLFLSGLSGVSKEEYGIASATLGSSSVIFGAVALALVGGQAAARDDSLVASGAGAAIAQTGFYSTALVFAGLLASTATVVSLWTAENR